MSLPGSDSTSVLYVMIREWAHNVGVGFGMREAVGSTTLRRPHAPPFIIRRGIVSSYGLFPYVLSVNIGRAPPQLAFGFCELCGDVFLLDGFVGVSFHNLCRCDMAHQLTCCVLVDRRKEALKHGKDNASTQRVRFGDPYG